MHRLPKLPTLSAWAICGFALLPLLAIVWVAIPSLTTLSSPALWELSLNTVKLTFATLAIATPLAVLNAWCLARYKLRAKAAFMILSLLPLALPGIVFATVWLTFYEPTAKPLFLDWLTLPTAIESGLWAAAIVVALGCYPYITLMVYAALQRIPESLERGMQMMGASRWQIFQQVLLPQLLPSILGGAILVALHVIADFGVVALLRFRTFAWVVYQRLDANFDFVAAAALSLLPMLASVALVLWQQNLSQKLKGKTRGTKLRQAAEATDGQKILIYGWLLLLALFAVFLPLLVLLDGAWKSASISVSDLAQNSALAGIAAVIISVALALLLTYQQWRQPSRPFALFSGVAGAGFAVPGPVFALGMLIVFVGLFGGAAINDYGGLLLAVGLGLRMLPLASQSLQTGFSSLPINTYTNARLTGMGALQRGWYVLTPWLSPAMLTAVVMVFVETAKELPLTMLLRPIGFDTLAVRIWIDASEEMLAQASSASLALVLLSLPSIWILYRGTQPARNRT